MSSLQPVPVSPSLDAATVERVLLHGDLRQLTSAQKVAYYRRVCDSLGLNPLTQPFAYIVLNGREVLYAKREATEQLRFTHNVSIEIKSREILEGCYVVTATATMPTGRRDESTGVVSIENSKGETRANLMLKAETKAKRRVTLSICGLGMLDESEVESLVLPPAAGVETPATAPQNSAAVETPAPMPANQVTITDTQRKKLWAVARRHGWTEPELKAWLKDLWNYDSTHAIRREHFDSICEQLGQHATDAEPR